MQQVPPKRRYCYYLDTGRYSEDSTVNVNHWYNLKSHITMGFMWPFGNYCKITFHHTFTRIRFVRTESNVRKVFLPITVNANQTSHFKTAVTFSRKKLIMSCWNRNYIQVPALESVNGKKIITLDHATPLSLWCFVTMRQKLHCQLTNQLSTPSFLKG